MGEALNGVGQVVASWPVTDPRWEALRTRFPEEQVGKLPKGKPRGEKVHCTICGTSHEPNLIHLDYVGHAFVTERLNEVDPGWVMEPMLADPIQYSGSMAFMPVRMTVLGVTKTDVGCADTRTDEWPKHLWSDCLTRVAMRFGVALHLWQKDKPPAPASGHQAGGARGGQRSGGYDRGGQRSGQRRGTQRGERGGSRARSMTDALGDLRAAVGGLDPDGAARWSAWKAEVDWDTRYREGTLDVADVDDALARVQSWLAADATPVDPPADDDDQPTDWDHDGGGEGY